MTYHAKHKSACAGVLTKAELDAITFRATKWCDLPSTCPVRSRGCVASCAGASSATDRAPPPQPARAAPRPAGRRLLRSCRPGAGSPDVQSVLPVLPHVQSVLRVLSHTASSLSHSMFCSTTHVLFSQRLLRGPSRYRRRSSRRRASSSQRLTTTAGTQRQRRRCSGILHPRSPTAVGDRLVRGEGRGVSD